MTTTTSEATARAALAHQASRHMASVTTQQKNEALERIAGALADEQAHIMEVNAPELERGHQRGLTDAFIERMTLTPERIAGIAADTRTVALLPDPVGEMFDTTTRPNGLQIGRIRVPLGVIGSIYEYSTGVATGPPGQAAHAGETARISRCREYGSVHS